MSRALFVRQELLSANNRTVVRDKNGKAVYLMVGKWGNRKDILSIYRLDGTLLGEVKQTKLALFPQFDLYFDNQKIASFKKFVGLWREFIYIPKIHWLVSGNLERHHYQIMQGNRLVMQMNRTFLADGDFLELVVSESKDEVLALCVAAILDSWRSETHKQTLSLFQHKPFPIQTTPFSERKRRLNNEH